MPCQGLWPQISKSLWGRPAGAGNAQLNAMEVAVVFLFAETSCCEHTIQGRLPRLGLSVLLWQASYTIGTGPLALQVSA